MSFDSFRESERDGWNLRAKGYAQATARATLQTIPTLLAHGKLTPDAVVLDAGCGPGYVAAHAFLQGAQVVGLDFAEQMVAQANLTFPHLEFLQGDVEKLPFDDQTFDAILSNIVLFHVTDPAKAMAEAFRTLKPGGRFVFSQWLGPEKSECYKLLFQVLGAHADMSQADPAPNAYALSEEENVFDLLKSAGFEACKSEVVQNVLYATGDDFYAFFQQFGVRVPLILSRQDKAVQDKIRTEINAQAEPFRVGDGFQIPMPSVVFSAAVPL